LPLNTDVFVGLYWQVGRGAWNVAQLVDAALPVDDFALELADVASNHHRWLSGAVLHEGWLAQHGLVGPPRHWRAVLRPLALVLLPAAAVAEEEAEGQASDGGRGRGRMIGASTRVFCHSLSTILCFMENHYRVNTW
jgi:hypothetical protein